MSNLVTDLPLWKNPNIRSRIPKDIELRKGKFKNQDEEIIAFWWPKYECYVAVSGETKPELDIVLGNLAGFAFEKEFPNTYDKVVRAIAESFYGKKFPAELEQPLKRMNEINSMIPGYKPLQVQGLN